MGTSMRIMDFIWCVIQHYFHVSDTSLVYDKRFNRKFMEEHYEVREFESDYLILCREIIYKSCFDM